MLTSAAFAEWLSVREGRLEFAQAATTTLRDFVDYLEEEGIPHAEVAPLLHELLDEVLNKAPADLTTAINKEAAKIRFKHKVARY